MAGTNSPGLRTLALIAVEEPISGVRAVAISQSGRIRIAMASVSGRMPAVGVVVDNVLSGAVATVENGGYFQYLSGVGNAGMFPEYSGNLSNRVWVGRSGHVVVMSGSYASGGWASGDLGQPLGIVFNSGGFLLNVAPIAFSGGPAVSIGTIF